VGAVAHLPVPDATNIFDLSSLGFASLSTTVACTACGACARACPTRAIQFIQNEKETTFMLALSARNCIGCEICVHVCVSSAISVNHTPTFIQIFGQEMVTLLEGGLVKCKWCGILMAAQPEVHLCQLCENRRTRPFGSKKLPRI
jgi:ferredoxin